jgi:hypothetical protein
MNQDTRTLRRRRCLHCKASFLPPPSNPYRKQCHACCTGTQSRDEEHTHEWDRRSLGLIESNILRRAWGAKRSNNVTEN